jgi:hypothetical protein
MRINSISQTISLHFKLSFIFLILAIFFGLLYSIQLLGYGVDIFTPANARSLHISLMLYGFAPLILSMLPFALFDKDSLCDKVGVRYLNLYFYIWYIFTVFLIVSLSFGDLRGLPFYDFPYELNFILAFSGIFYLLAILRYIKLYQIKPFWVKVSLFVIILSPFLLIFLMNPNYGQVEKMLQGSHGDNTLGMSFTFIVLYYLVIKLHASDDFKPRYHILWLTPLIFYILSVLYRTFIDNLSYNQEWFLQWITLLYIPILYIWLRDAKIKLHSNLFLYISVISFIFVDIEGNILFIPSIRPLFHRNDIVVGHAHIAVGVAMLFLSFSVVQKYFTISKKIIYILTVLIYIMGMALSISGFTQAGFELFSTQSMWYIRTILGVLIFILLLKFYLSKLTLKGLSNLQYYHIGGFLSDGLGGVLLLFFAKPIYAIVGVEYHIGYQSIIFGFMIGVGIIHLIGAIKQEYSNAMAIASVISRVIVASLFFTLHHTLNILALGISGYDLLYAIIFLVCFYEI